MSLAGVDWLSAALTVKLNRPMVGPFKGGWRPGSLAWGYGRCNNRTPLEPYSNAKYSLRLPLELSLQNDSSDSLSHLKLRQVITDRLSQGHRSILLPNRTAHLPIKTLYPTRSIRGTLRALIGFLVLLAPTAFAQDAPLSRQEELRQQREAKSRAVKPYKPGSLEGGTLYVQKRRLLERFAEGWKGFHPVLGGMSTGSGFAGGVRYEKGFADGALSFKTSGAISTRVYQLYDLSFGAPKLLGGKLSLDFYSRYRSFPQEDFFGLGPDSRKQDRTNFAQEDSLFDFTLGWNWTRWLTTGARVGYLQTNIGRGTDKRFPSTEDLFSSTDFPELIHQPNYYHADAFFRIDYRDEPLNAHSGGLFELTYNVLRRSEAESLQFPTLRRRPAAVFPFLERRNGSSRFAPTLLSQTPAQDKAFHFT